MKLWLVLLVLAIPAVVFPQGEKWITVTAEYSGADVTPEEGKQRALEIARGEAIKQVVGVSTTEEIYRNQAEAMEGGVSKDALDIFSKLSRSTASGKIIREEKEEKTIVENNQPVYLITLHALVVPDASQTDPTFQLTINIDRDVYYDRSPSQSDEVRWTISSTRHCYLYLFNILSNDSVQLLMPTEFLPMNEFKVDAKMQSFEDAIRAKTIHFHVAVPEGKLRTKEALYLIGTKEKIDFHPGHFAEGGKNLLLARVAAVVDIMNWLVRIPPDMRTETFRSYEIRKWGSD